MENENRRKEIELMKGKFAGLLYVVDRPGVDKLLAHLEGIHFFEAPCSGGNHLAKEGGLLEHSLNVHEMMETIAYVVCGDKPIGGITKESVIISALLHDLGKCGDFGKPNYVPNMIKDGRPTKVEPEQKYKQSEDKPYRTNPELLYIPHEVRSIAIARQFIPLTEQEEHAIYYHNGKYTHTGYDLKETPLQMLLHFADLWCSRVIELEDDNGEVGN